MQRGDRFITKIDAVKREIESRHAKEFNKLYRRIGNDLINIVTNSNFVNFNTIIANYKPDYIYLFRRIFQDAKESGFGLEIRKQFNFNKRNIIELKSVEVAKEEQDKVNNKFDVLYTLLLNNKTESMVNDDFLKSEATYFEKIYTNSQSDYIDYVNDIKKEINDTKNEIFVLTGSLMLSKIQKRKTLQKRLEALETQLKKVESESKTETVKIFKSNLENKISTRSNSNAEYGTGQASSEIRDAEYEAFKQSGATQTAAAEVVLLINRIKKVWWERSQFILRATPRINHLALSGTESDEQGNFFVGGYYIPKPRDVILPAEEAARCRCEVEYVVY